MRHEQPPLTHEPIVVAAPELPKRAITILALSGAANIAWVIWLGWLILQPAVG
jgi:hypothetical protein